ncbi:MAG: hypothetical protein KGH61_01430 [Candidatus Micrarchaeota archaeon]|nr:hypothetical protein [Candidatus Micrarchaeota archaeon]MDE1847592.1 hypothetical protein [Candidatus Micrarchaeota archaeon]MDE1864824.1 hypothetical protein [Candidatus Micrarchaeota archaeon]
MPKVIDKERREELKSKMLKLLSINGRMSIGNLGKNLKITKPSAYHLFLETVKEYDLKFVPEIDMSKIWRYEFIKLSRMRTKKEILDEAIEEIPEAGFEEYVVMFKFLGKQPKEEEILKAVGGSHMPQFIATLSGKYNLMMYIVARDYEAMNRFIVEFSKRLKKPLVSELNRIEGSLGFFPLRNELMQDFNISETYLSLLLGLNEDGRQEFISIAKKFKKEQQGMVYAMDRLKRTGILRRVTYYEGKPKNTNNAIVQVKITDYEKFLANRNGYYTEMLNGNGKRHCEYTYMCDISNPQGSYMLLNFPDKESSRKFFSSLKRSIKGAELTFIPMSKILIGRVGIRDFDMRYSSQYRALEGAKLVPRFERKEDGSIEVESQEQGIDIQELHGMGEIEN